MCGRNGRTGVSLPALFFHAWHDEVRRASWLWEFRPGLLTDHATRLGHLSRCLKPICILLCANSAFSVSLWLRIPRKSHHRDTENAEFAQRKPKLVHYRSIRLLRAEAADKIRVQPFIPQVRR